MSRARGPGPEDGRDDVGPGRSRQHIGVDVTMSAPAPQLPPPLFSSPISVKVNFFVVQE